ncbi:hypothetical protein NYF23_09075 [SAR92 clade bacterium H455]|uniref:Uncharacterized protein n=1 Tax=SAR92 clade bacterium H455 TaxID=2974818 RepID=A0ABY5TK05_9GAMM|nr:hypothetical protein NYF23_09075 [SAR92 clade bacterium H455]
MGSATIRHYNHKLSIKDAQIEEGTVPEHRVGAPEATGGKTEAHSPRNLIFKI